MAHLHSSFFEMIDEELHAYSRQVEFAEPNFPTYSVYLAGLYVSICSEIDVVAKLLCQRIKPDSKADNIRDYRLLITEHYYFLPNLKITILPISLDLVPWLAWLDTGYGKNPDWWEHHQNVKHRRNEFFQYANLGNVLSSAAGLLVLLTYWNCDEIIHCEVTPNFPSADEQSARVTLSHEELSLLLGGIELTRTRRKNWYRKELEPSEKM